MLGEAMQRRDSIPALGHNDETLPFNIRRNIRIAQAKCDLNFTVEVSDP